MKKVLFILLGLGMNAAVNAQCNIDFSTQAASLGSYGVNVTISGVSSVYSIAVDWGDGSNPSLGFTDQYSHSYANYGTYQICIDYLDANGCYQQVCHSYTLANVPNLCPMTVNPSLNGNTLTVAASGSGAGIPYLAFVYDLWAYIADPFNFSLIDAQPGNAHTFTHTYAPSGNESFTYCVEYGDQNDPGACEANSYCATISFGTGLGIADKGQITEVQLYPVPADDYLNVYVNEPTADNPISYSIVDSEGKTVDSGFITNNTSTILLPESMQSGNYFFTVSGGNSTRTLTFSKL
jgi:hypothetical protein